MAMLPDDANPYAEFSRTRWAALRADMPLTLSADEVERLSSLNDPVDLDEVTDVYLPLSRLLSLYVAATQMLFRATQSFLGATDGKMPYVIGIGGSVAVGKSTTARLLQALLSRWPNTPKVDLVTTDGFLKPNARLAAEGLMERKGFPESYDIASLISFLSRIKAGSRNVTAPVYSHIDYDVVPGAEVTVDRPDILILEGLNVLQTARPPREGKAVPFVSDFFDFSVYIDAPEDEIRRWYLERFLRLRETAFQNPRSFFHRYASVNEDEARRVGTQLWETINRVNLRENIQPTRQRASLILTKGADHRVETVALRKL